MIFKSGCEVLSLEVCKHSLMLSILDFVIHVSKEVMSSNCSESKRFNTRRGFQMGKVCSHSAGDPFCPTWVSLVIQLVENLPAMWETWL